MSGQQPGALVTPFHESQHGLLIETIASIDEIGTHNIVKLPAARALGIFVSNSTPTCSALLQRQLAYQRQTFVEDSHTEA